MSARPRLVAFGDLFLDVVVAPAQDIERGTDVPGEVHFRRGGSAANTAAAFARAGGAAALITCLGDDGWDRRLASSLRRDGVRIHALRRHGRSGRLAALVDRSGERSFVTDRGVADSVRESDVRKAWISGASVLHVPAYSLLGEPIGSAALAAAAMAREAGVLLSSDLSSAEPIRAYGVRRSRSRMRELGADVLFANRDEAAVLLQRAGRRAWPELLDLAPLVIVKDGLAGCRVLWRGPDADATLQIDVAAQRLGRVDSTGAGDAFAAGFLYALLRDAGPSAPMQSRALRRAAVAGHRAAAAAIRRPRPELELG